MREIKFRAYVPELRKMVDVFAVNPMNRTVYLSHVHLFGTEGDDVLAKYGDAPDEVKLVQSTGVRDRNGVEIYEGDLIRHYAVKAEIGSVHFGKYVTGNESNEDILGWIVHFPMNAEALDPQRDWEVIRNRHDNSELLEVTLWPQPKPSALQSNSPTTTATTTLHSSEPWI
ncbi:hypothetical protein JXX30_11890 [Rhodococcus erythropolis]|uniref:YopX family protein n=1 Tax=Rhodococcus TaxID=1827 RepID=UPI00198021F0|nr:MULTISPECIES: YopX family protein [Rhodococcus]MCJ0895980.1 YopX family protein [Rhodococcus sp. ARC_M13]QSE43405.1 hypothetical protein JXX30_11890 [Rhodococcus erythropolis]